MKKTLLALITAATLAATPGASFGPPWISIEYPPSPYDRTTRDALLLVHAFHHGTPVDLPVSGTAEGNVDGQRRSVRLTFDRTSREGVYALKRQWGSTGSWVLSIAVRQEQHGDVAGALVELDARGNVVAVRVPTTRRDGWDIPRAIAASEIEAALASRVALASARTGK
jgi:hypothetical protein